MGSLSIPNESDSMASFLLLNIGDLIFPFTCHKLSSADELRKLLSDKDAYQRFLLSLDQVKIQNNVSCIVFTSVHTRL